MTKVCYEICKITDYSHLTQLEDGVQKATKAKVAVNQLRQLVEPHQDVKKEQEDI